MDGSQGRIARMTTRAVLGAAWVAGAALGLHETLTGAPPEPFAGFVVLPAALLLGAGAARAIDALVARCARGRPGTARPPRPVTRGRRWQPRLAARGRRVAGGEPAA